MVFYQAQPLHLLVCEVYSTGIAFERPAHEVIVDRFCKWLQIITIAHLKADNGNEVSQLMHGGLATNLVRLLDSIAIPQAVNGHSLRFKLLIKSFKPVYDHGTVFICLAVNNTQSNDFIFIFLNEIPEALNNPVSISLLLVVESGKNHGIRICIVNYLLMAAAHIFNELTYFRVMKGLDRFNNGFFPDLGILLRSGFST